MIYKYILLLMLVLSSLTYADPSQEWEPYIITDQEEAIEQANLFISDHGLPLYSAVILDQSGNIRIIWETQYYHTDAKGQVSVSVSQAHLILVPDGEPIIETYGYGNEAAPYLPGIQYKWTYPQPHPRPSSPLKILLFMEKHAEAKNDKQIGQQNIF